MFKYLQSA